jgi:hypothetical protein
MVRVILSAPPRGPGVSIGTIGPEKYDVTSRADGFHISIECEAIWR